MVSTTLGNNNEKQQQHTISPAPQLLFDDGSRIMKQEFHHAASSKNNSYVRDPSISIYEYYEIERLVNEIYQLLNTKNNVNNNTNNTYSVRVAVQIPDELLIDAPDVCWEFENAIRGALVFCLGDSSAISCCPDVASAKHLNADILIHYGHACLLPCTQIPVLYSFGGRKSIIKTNPVEKTVVQSASEIAMIQTCTNDILQYLKQTNESNEQKLLLLYELRYHSIIDEIKSILTESGNLSVAIGSIPSSNKLYDNDDSGQTLLQSLDTQKEGTDHFTTYTFLTGGLEISNTFYFTNYTLVFIGNDTSRQYMNIVLRFLSSESKRPQKFWIWRPAVFLELYNNQQPTIESGTVDETIAISSNSDIFSTELSNIFQRKLNRRFYLVEKAKTCSVFGIVVANLSNIYLHSVVQSLQNLIEYNILDSTTATTTSNDQKQRTGRTSYTFAVGKVNVAILSNFSEIDCFILVACPEHSLLGDEKEYPVPIITPLELCMAFNVIQWGSVDYCLDVKEYLSVLSESKTTTSKNRTYGNDGDNDDDDNDSDAPYFSLVTGGYESSKHDSMDRFKGDYTGNNVAGQGAITTYNSAAAELFKQREYQGLDIISNTKDATVHTAIQGQTGIASKYHGDR